MLGCGRSRNVLLRLHQHRERAFLLHDLVVEFGRLIHLLIGDVGVIDATQVLAERRLEGDDAGLRIGDALSEGSHDGFLSIRSACGRLAVNDGTLDGSVSLAMLGENETLRVIGDLQGFSDG